MSVISASQQLLFGLVLVVLAPLLYRFEPMLRERIHAFWRIEPRASAYSEFQRIGGTLFLLIVGLVLIIGSFVRFA